MWARAIVGLRLESEDIQNLEASKAVNVMEAVSEKEMRRTPWWRNRGHSSRVDWVERRTMSLLEERPRFVEGDDGEAGSAEDCPIDRDALCGWGVADGLWREQTGSPTNLR